MPVPELKIDWHFLGVFMMRYINRDFAYIENDKHCVLSFGCEFQGQELGDRNALILAFRALADIVIENNEDPKEFLETALREVTH